MKLVEGVVHVAANVKPRRVTQPGIWNRCRFHKAEIGREIARTAKRVTSYAGKTGALYVEIVSSAERKVGSADKRINALVIPGAAKVQGRARRGQSRTARCTDGLADDRRPRQAGMRLQNTVELKSSKEFSQQTVLASEERQVVQT